MNTDLGTEQHRVITNKCNSENKMNWLTDQSLKNLLGDERKKLS